MGVASIPECKDQRARDEWNDLRTIRKMDVAKSGIAKEDFVTVVSVEGHQPPAPDNFVTVLSIGTGAKEEKKKEEKKRTRKEEKQEEDDARTRTRCNGIADGPLEEEVEVYRLPGERLGFGLKFEGGNKTSERVRRLFVQSCAEQSPASRAKCSWGTLGEGDEVLSIDGVPVTHMTRLDCVRRLQESQLVIKLMVRCRGALRPEVVSAEKKCAAPEKRERVPPELPSQPPPVPPRKLRQARGSADGEANPSPVRKSWNGTGTGSSSQTGSPCSQTASQSTGTSGSFQSCESSPRSANDASRQHSPRGSPNEKRSPDISSRKSKQEPAEAMVYMDARSQCGSTHGSASDDTGSSMSTVIDRFCASDRVSTISSASTASEQPNVDGDGETEPDEPRPSKGISPLDKLMGADYPAPRAAESDYLLRRLAISEAVTHVESRGEVEKITAVVAPNTVLIEETIAFQPPLSFQDAPLSYGHEARPDLFYTADLAADSTTHFRPIRDDADLVERVNGVREEAGREPRLAGDEEAAATPPPPPLPARNHVNRIAVNQPGEPRVQKAGAIGEIGASSSSSSSSSVAASSSSSSASVSDSLGRDAPVLPPKPLPRRDAKGRRKRPPPPPPPPPAVAPRAELKSSSLPESRQTSFEKEEEEEEESAIPSSSPLKSVPEEGNEAGKKRLEETDDTESVENYDPREEAAASRTNKVLEIIEIRKARALRFSSLENASGNERTGAGRAETCESEPGILISADLDDSADEQVTKFNEPVDDSDDAECVRDEEPTGTATRRDAAYEPQRNEEEEEDTSEDSEDDGDYYWQSNLATIGEEEETNSLEYTDANKETSDDSDCDCAATEKPSSQESAAGKKDAFDGNARNDEIEDAKRTANTFPEAPAENLQAEAVNGRMENCGGGQRLPPDGDEFPAAYQEFGVGVVSVQQQQQQQQYRFVTSGAATTATARTSTMLANGRLVCAEHEESYKLLDGGGTIAAAPTTTTATENKIGVVPENVRQEVGGRNGLLLAGIEVNGKASTAIVCQEAGETGGDAKPYISDELAVKKAAAAVTNYSSYGNHHQQQQGNGNASAEKKIEITAYYHKDASPLQLPAPMAMPVIEQQEKDAPDTPPPLPLTGPPKLEPSGGYARSVSVGEATPRKFSLNGELWRQDDKSERSVRDKIAMFSSQSSLDGPLFPSSVTAAAAAASASASATGNARRLSRYKSTEDVCSEERSFCGAGPRPASGGCFFGDRTQSSFDLTDSARCQDPGRRYGPRSPSATSVATPTPTITGSRTFPIVPQKPASYDSSKTPKYGLAAKPTPAPAPASSALARATSFSGTTPGYGQDRGAANDSPVGAQIARTNSLASTFKRPAEDIRRTSLNQLIEQRRRSISKLRGLVIPEKEAIPIDAPIVDLPEIKSRDSILLHQLPKASIQDKWGSQSSLASNASTASAPLKATASFKMPAPQIHSKYSPAFKRKSLAVYGSASASTATTGPGPTKTSASAPSPSDPPKSLESICSPTRSDYSFEFASSSPEGGRGRPRVGHRKARLEYDDSDNDSAVSSSRSSISRGFSPPMSPVPSERSTVSSERSYVSTETYRRQSIATVDGGTRTYGGAGDRSGRESTAMVEYNGRPGIFATERSSSSGSNGSDPRSPSTESGARNSGSQIPQRQLKRSNSTETNCSTSSTLTSGSQASAESLSRRVLKPQSVEAINRKNILASARCRSGRDLNGSPLIQRKFPDEENRQATVTVTENGEATYCRSGRGKDAVDCVLPPSGGQDVKIAYIEVTDSFAEDEAARRERNEPEEAARGTPRIVATGKVTVRSAAKFETIEPSNDLKMWLRTEAKALARSMEDKAVVRGEKKSSGSGPSSPGHAGPRNRNGRVAEPDPSGGNETQATPSQGCQASKRASSEEPNDLLTILTTRSRSRSAIHVDDGSFARSKSLVQMSLEDILGAKGEEPGKAATAAAARSQTTESRTSTEKSVLVSGGQSQRSLWESRDNRYVRRSSVSALNEWSDEKTHSASKIPTLGRSRLADSSGDEMNASPAETEKARSPPSRIPAARNLGRRSASVTDMKRALELNCGTAASPHHHQGTSPGLAPAHHRFPSLDSSVDESVSPVGTDVDADRYCGEQFGSISSLASSTSLISQQELAQLVEEASLEEARGAHDVIVVLLHKENPSGSVGITLAGGADCEIKEITVHRVLAHSIADKDGRVQRGDRILSINGRGTQGLTHRESIAVLKQPRSEVVLVVSRARSEDGCGRLRSRTASVETIIEGFETNDTVEDTAWGPPSVVAVYKGAAGLGFSLEGGRDSPLGDRPLVIKKIFTGGAAEKTGALKAGDQLLEVNGYDVTRMSRIEAWSLMKKLHDGEVNLLVRHPATKSS